MYDLKGVDHINHSCLPGHGKAPLLWSAVSIYDGYSGWANVTGHHAAVHWGALFVYVSSYKYITSSQRPGD